MACLRCCLDRHSLRDGPLKTADAIAMKLGINKTAMSGCVLVSVLCGGATCPLFFWLHGGCGRRRHPPNKPLRIRGLVRALIRHER
jgi:hypothetical protein